MISWEGSLADARPDRRQGTKFQRQLPKLQPKLSSQSGGTSPVTKVIVGFSVVPTQYLGYIDYPGRYYIGN